MNKSILFLFPLIGLGVLGTMFGSEVQSEAEKILQREDDSGKRLLEGAMITGLVFNEAVDAGKDVSKIKTPADAAAAVANGLRGGGFYSKQDIAQMVIPDDLPLIAALLELKSNKRLNAGPTLNRTAMECQMRLVEVKARRNAQHLASLFGAGRAAGSPELLKAASLTEAWKLITEGVKGGGQFSTTNFRIGPRTKEEIALANSFLKFDPIEGITYIGAAKLATIDAATKKTLPNILELMARAE